MDSTVASIYQPISFSRSASYGIDEVDRRLNEPCDNEEILTIINELDATKRQLIAEQQRVSELEDQLSSLSKLNH